MLMRVQTLIFYAVIMVLLIAAYHVATGFAFAIVEDGFRFMEPTVDPRETVLLDKRSSTIRSLQPDDVIAYSAIQSGKTVRMFGRVAAIQGMTVTVRDGRLLVEGSDRAYAPRVLALLKTGLMVPRETVFVIFDSRTGRKVSLSQRLVPYRSILGRAVSK